MLWHGTPGNALSTRSPGVLLAPSMKIQNCPRGPFAELLAHPQLVNEVDELFDQGEIDVALEKLQAFRAQLQRQRHQYLTDPMLAPLRQRLDSQSEDVDVRIAALRKGTYGQAFTALSVYEDVYVGAIARNDRDMLRNSIGFLERAANLSGPRRAQTLRGWALDLRKRQTQDQPPPYKP